MPVIKFRESNFSPTIRRILHRQQGARFRKPSPVFFGSSAGPNFPPRKRPTEPWQNLLVIASCQPANQCPTSSSPRTDSFPPQTLLFPPVAAKKKRRPSDCPLGEGRPSIPRKTRRFAFSSKNLDDIPISLLRPPPASCERSHQSFVEQPPFYPWESERFCTSGNSFLEAPPQ